MKVSCKKCGGYGDCACYGDVSPTPEVYVKYTFSCVCGRQEEEYVHGGCSSFYDYFTSCPYCNVGEREHVG